MRQLSLAPVACLLSLILSACGGGGGGGGSDWVATVTAPVASSLTFNQFNALALLHQGSSSFTMNSGTATLQQQFTQGTAEVVDGATYSVSSTLQVLTVGGVQQSSTTQKTYYTNNPFSIYIPIQADAANGLRYPTISSAVAIPTSVKAGDFGTYWTWEKKYIPNTPAQTAAGIEQCWTCSTQNGTVTWTAEADTATTLSFCFTNGSKFCYIINSSNQVIGRQITTSGVTYK